ncbi:DUF961 family protein [Clostridium paridis]|uniref:DUF961 family protein n=1 Tax=Clostridium paridis TaxID=2803863 RepID=A0A937FF99_9CLOT|nr:DUF961 family protein [Clostridium paridis]MBL4932284.1 DUF961 family protein [Clostridium paridis]
MAKVMKIIPDINKTFGDLMYLGKEDRFLYVDGKKGETPTGAIYKLASSIQGGEVSVYIEGTPKEFGFMSKVSVKDVEITHRAQVSGNFANVITAINAVDIVSVDKNSSNQGNQAPGAK